MREKRKMYLCTFSFSQACKNSNFNLKINKKLDKVSDKKKRET